MGATLRILPNGSFNLSSDGLENFPPESAAVPQMASETEPRALDDTDPGPVLMEAVAAYPPKDAHPSSSAFLSHGTYQVRPDSAARSPIGSSVMRALRAVVLFPFRVVSFILLRVWWAVCGVWQAVTGAVTLVVSGIWSLITGAGSLVMAGVRAVGRGILAVVTGTWNAIRSAGAAVAGFARAVVQGIVRAIVHTITSIANAMTAMVRAVAFAIWSVVSAAAGLVVACVNAVRRGIAAAVAFVWHTIAACGAAIAAFARAIVLGIANAITNTIGLVLAVTAAVAEGVAATGRGVRNAVTATVALLLHAVRSVAHAIAATVRAVVSGVWNVVTGTAGLVMAGVHAVRRGIAASALFVWHAIAACGAAIAGFARAVVRGIAHAIAHAIGFAGAVLAATGRGVRAVVVSAATLIVSTLAGIAGAIAAIAWAIVVGLWSLVRGTAGLLVAGVRAVRRGVPAAISFARHAVAACGAGVVFLARAAGRDLHTSFARTSALIQLGSDATAARGVTGLHAIGRHLSAGFAAMAGAAGRGAASVTALTGALEQAAQRATVRSGVAATRASGISLRAKQRLTALVDAAAARVALAGVPSWARHGLMAPAMVVVLGATVATSSGVLLMSWHPATPSAPPAPAMAANSIPPAQAALDPAVTPGSAPRAGANSLSGRAAKASTAGTESVRASSPTALSPSERTRRTVNATQVKALWGKTDTRSLDRALSAIRSATLAFQRCNLEMTGADAAVAHCDEARVSDGQSSSRRRPVAWTIDFRRADARWLIERISTSTTASNR